MVFGCIYRPPDSPVNFWNELEDEVDDISSFMDMLPLLHVLVDFDVNVLNPPNISNHNRLQDFRDNAGLRHVILSPTRLPSDTCIDLVLLPSHLPTIRRSLLTSRQIRKPSIRALEPNGFGPDFLQSLSSRDVSDMTQDELTQYWTATLHATFERHCPMKSVSNSTHPSPSPWMTPELRALLLKCKHLHRKWRKHPNDERLRQEFRAAR